MVRMVRRLPSWMLAIGDQAAVSGLNFAVMLFAARLMSVEGFGEFGLVWLVMLFVTNVHLALVLAPVPVLYPEHEGDRAKLYVGSIWVINKIWSFTVALLTIISALVWPDFSMVICSAGLAIVARFFLETERRLAYVFDRLDLAVIGDGISAIGTMAYLGAALAGMFAVDNATLLLVVAVASLLGASLVRIGTRHYGLKAQRQEVGEDAKGHWSFGRWGLGSTVAMWFSNQSYPFVIAAAMTLAEVAIFNAAKTIMGLTHFLMQGIDVYTVPVLRRSFLNEDWPTFARNGRRLLGVCLAVLIVPCLAIALFPGAMLQVFYADKYAGTEMVVQALAVIYILTTTNRILQIYLVTLKEPRAGFSAQIINAVLTMTLAPLLITSYGIAGALFAYAANQAISLVTFVRFAIVRTGSVRGSKSALVQEPSP